MIRSIFIKNFKAYEKETIKISKNNLLIGENDAGKSTILEALDIFFNKEKIDKELIRNPNIDVEIGVLVDAIPPSVSFIKKIYKGKTGKYDSYSGNISLVNDLSYVFIQSGMIDIKKLISDLAIAKVKKGMSPELNNELKTLFEDSINSVLETIDGRLMVVGNSVTSFSQETTLKIDGAVKYDINTSGIPLEGRGSGFKKTVIYSLLTKSSYENVIVGIDEIENSLSTKNAMSLINVVKDLFYQSLITTHSVHLMSCVDSSTVLPILKDGEAATVAEMISGLGNITDKKFVLVEGKTDMIWINKVISLMGKQDDYVVIQCGGCSNIVPVKDELVLKGYVCFEIKDGDTHSDTSLSKECIELYTPLDVFNSLFGCDEPSIPSSKKSFFDVAKSYVPNISEDSVKEMIAEKVDDFLTLDNTLVEEVKVLLGLE